MTSRDIVTAGLQDNGTRVRSGSTAVFSQRIYADGFGTVVHPLNSDLLLGSAYFTRILKSSDGGKTFHGSYSGIIEANKNKLAPFFTRIIASPADSTGNTVYTFVDQKIYKSANFGDSWSPIKIENFTGSIRNLGVSASDSQSLALVSDDSSILLTTNGGISWKRAAGGLPRSQGRLSYISFNPTDSKTIYVSSVAPNINASHLWKSTDGGATWRAIDKAANFPQGVPINIVVGDPGDGQTIYAGTHLGLYKSTDGGENWTRFGFGLPLVSVTDIYISPDSSLVRVATFGRGIWQLTE
ncbi:MAG TPA: YCF48-related protein [Thermoanaerobaculia bacterium]